MTHIDSKWITPSVFTFTQGEVHDYIGSRLGKAITNIKDFSDLIAVIEYSSTSDSFLLISNEAVEILNSYATPESDASGMTFRLELNEGDAYSGRAVYKSKTIGGVEFKSAINCLLFDAPGEPIAFIARVEDFKTDSGKAQLSVETLQGTWNTDEGQYNLVNRDQVIFNDANGRAFLFRRGASFLLVHPKPVPDPVAPEAEVVPLDVVPASDAETPQAA